MESAEPAEDDAERLPPGANRRARGAEPLGVPHIPAAGWLRRLPSAAASMPGGPRPMAYKKPGAA